MIGLDLSESAELEVIWTINPRVLLRSKPNLGFDMSHFNFFNVNFVRLELFLF